MRYVYRPDHPRADENGMVPKHVAPFTVVRSGYVISDVMSPVRHMGTGRVHDSKSEFRKDTRAVGADEVGTDPSIRRERPRYPLMVEDIAADVKRAIEQLRSR